jgi:hypothetical protein
MTANLAQNFFLCAEPNTPKVTKTVMNGQAFSFTPWDSTQSYSGDSCSLPIFTGDIDGKY